MQSMMRAVALAGAYNIIVVDVPKPTIENSTDALVRITASAICGSDLHYYHQGQDSPEEPVPIGHEAIGYIEEVGDAVEFLSVGDYVVIPFALDDGHFQYGPTVDYVRAGAGGMQGTPVTHPLLIAADLSSRICAHTLRGSLAHARAHQR